MPTAVYDYDPRNVPQGILLAIGLVTTCTAQTESMVENGIGGCLGIEVDFSAALTTHMNAPLRDHILRACAELRIDDLDDLDELDRLLDNVNKAFEKRNKYVHNPYCMKSETGQCFISTMTARGSLDAELVPITAEEIKADAVFIYEAGINLMGFLGPRGLMPSFPKARRERMHKTRAARKKRRKALLKGE